MLFSIVSRGAMALLLGTALIDPANAAGIVGTLDPATGAFHPLVTGPVAPATSTFSGEFIVAFTIDVASSIASGTTLTCSFNAVTATSTGAYFSESASAPVTRSGSKAACAISLPYSWIGVTSSGLVSFTATIEATNGSRIWIHTLPSITMPSSGSHTHVSVPATI